MNPAETRAAAANNRLPSMRRSFLGNPNRGGRSPSTISSFGGTSWIAADLLARHPQTAVETHHGAVQHGVADDLLDEARVLVRFTESGRKWHLRRQRLTNRFPKPRKQRRVEHPRRHGDHPNPRTG